MFLREDAEGNSRRPFLCLRRGVSPCRPSLWESLPLFSAYAEVFLTKQKHSGFIRAFLCLRRGVSFSGAVNTQAQGFSLPTQRCFQPAIPFFPRGVLFSAYAEVFLVLLLSPLCGANFSLPTQRCFSFTLHSPRSVGLFSAYAEVFLYAVIRASSSVSFLCLRRGVSRGLLQFELERGFSLPTQRCFYRS